jgi:hypothetical protein
VTIHPCPESVQPVFEFGERDFHDDKNWGRRDDKTDEIRAYGRMSERRYENIVYGPKLSALPLSEKVMGERAEAHLSLFHLEAFEQEHLRWLSRGWNQTRHSSGTAGS